MSCLSIVMVLLYYLLFIIYYQHIVPANNRRVPQIILTLLFVTTSYVWLNATNLLVFNFPSIMLIMIIGLRFSTGMNWIQAFYSGSFCAITAYCFRGIFTAVYALIYKGSNLLYSANAYYIISLIALPFSLLLLFILRRTIFPDKKLKQFLSNSSQLRLVVVYELTAVVNLVVINSGRKLSPNSTWYMEIALGACTLTVFMLIFATYQSIKSTELLEYQWRMQELEDQYERQLQHYKSYQKYTESFQEFKHDYKSMIGAIKSLIRANDYAKAVQLIDDIYGDMQKKVHIHKRYSNSVILDAMLQDLANICMVNKIRFSFSVFTPQNANLSALDEIRVFSNITNNAVEACLKVPPSDRFIEINSGRNQQWITLEAVNSFDGKAIMENGRLITTKSEKHSHGLGVNIVTTVVENLGGFVIYNADSESKTFLIRIHIPYYQDNSIV